MKPPLITKGPRHLRRTKLINRLQGFQDAPVDGNVDCELSEEFLAHLAMYGPLWRRDQAVGRAPAFKASAMRTLKSLGLRTREVSLKGCNGRCIVWQRILNAGFYSNAIPCC